MTSYNWDFSVIINNKEAIIKGVLITIELTVLSIIIGSVLGIILAYFKSSKNKLLKYFSTSIIEIFVDLPLLVLMIWIFYTLPPLIGITLSAFVTAIIALSLNLGAFSAEIFRSGINSIPKGQIHAAETLGLKKIQILRHIIFPQALKVIIPPITGRYIETIKLTSLASIISVNELLHQGQTIIGNTYRPLEVYTVVALAYLTIITPLSLLSKKFENKKNVKS
jgi:polar amino acid transport system permease protein